MFAVFLSTFFILSVLSEAPLPPPPPPQDVHVNQWLLTWTPADTEEGKVTFTVEYSNFKWKELDSSKNWYKVPACVHISSNSCDVTTVRTTGEHRCVRLRVTAERRGLRSSPVEACSQHSDTCTPDVKLTELPGALVVHLNTKHELYTEHGDEAKHRIYWRKEGALQEEHTDNLSTVTIPGLEEGQRYCVRTQYVYFDKVVTGLPRCPRCVLVPGPEKDSNQTALIVSLVVVVVLVILIPLIAYVLINFREAIKRFMQPYEIPNHFLRVEPISERRPPVNTSCCVDEPYDVISVPTSI